MSFTFHSLQINILDINLKSQKTPQIISVHFKVYLKIISKVYQIQIMWLHESCNHIVFLVYSCDSACVCIKPAPFLLKNLYRVIKKSLCTWRQYKKHTKIQYFKQFQSSNMDRAILNTVFENTVRHVNKCLETGGGHFEHYL